MTAHFKIEVDQRHNLVRQFLGGFFGGEDVELFVAARNDAHRQLNCGPNEHVTLVDIREMKIQPQEMVEAFSTVLADPRHRSRKLAFVCATSLARMQLRRAAGERDARYFSEPADAEAWLLSEEADGDKISQLPAGNLPQILLSQQIGNYR